MNEKRDYQRTYNQRKRQALIAFLGGKCIICGFDEYPALQVDHVSGGGSAHRKEIGYSAAALYKAVMDKPSEYQLLCANCNWIKRHIEKETGIQSPPTGKEVHAASVVRREYAERVVDQLLSGELTRHNAIERLKVVIF